MAFALTFTTGNDAFTDGAGLTETARILREVADLLERGRRSMRVCDINGNGVGSFTLSASEPDAYPPSDLDTFTAAHS